MKSMPLSFVTFTLPPASGHLPRKPGGEGVCGVQHNPRGGAEGGRLIIAPTGAEEDGGRLIIAPTFGRLITAPTGEGGGQGMGLVKATARPRMRTRFMSSPQ